MLGRGFHRRCPVCADPGIFTHWTALVDACPGCGTPLAGREGDTYFVYYISMALITGVFLVTTIADGLRPRHDGG